MFQNKPGNSKPTTEVKTRGKYIHKALGNYVSIEVGRKDLCCTRRENIYPHSHNNLFTFESYLLAASLHSRVKVCVYKSCIGLMSLSSFCQNISLCTRIRTSIGHPSCRMKLIKLCQLKSLIGFHRNFPHIPHLALT